MAVESPTVESQPAKAAVPLSQPLYGASFVEAVDPVLQEVRRPSPAARAGASSGGGSSRAAS